MRLIGLTGPAGSGKDTVADLLCSQHGFVQIAFADPLRDGIKAMFPWITDTHLTDRALKEAPLAELGKSPRQILQTLGTEWGRDLIHPEIWLIAATHRLAKLRASSPCLHIAGVVVSDVRFENEADWCATTAARSGTCAGNSAPRLPTTSANPA